MKQKLLAVLLIAALTGMMFAGCQTAPEVPEQPQNNVVTGNNQAGETTTPKEDVTLPEQPTQEPSSAVTPTIPTEAPEFTDAPLATVAPTEIPEITEELVATSTPIPTATAEPTATPEPTATVAPTATPVPEAVYTYSELNKTMYAKSTVNVRTLPSTDGNKIGSLSANDKITVTGKCNETGWYQIIYNNETAYVSDDYLVDNLPTPKPTQKPDNNNTSNTEKIVFPTYPCGEKGEEVLELVKSLREKYSNKDDYWLTQFIILNYDYSEQDILYGVYNSGWQQECSNIIEKTLINQKFISKHNLLVIFSEQPYIEKDVISAIDNYGIDWNEQAVKTLEHLLNSNGCSYKETFVIINTYNFTNEQIEYAFKTVNPDWNEQAAQKAHFYITSVPSGISYSKLIDALISSHNFEKDQVDYAMNSIKDIVNWNEQAYKMAKYFAPYKNSKNELITALKVNDFTDEQIKYAINKIGW